MAFNVRSGGEHEVLPVPNTVVSGDLVRVGSFVGIAVTDAYQGEDSNWYATVALEGIAHAPISSAVTVGQPLYVSAAGPGKVALTTTATDNKSVGIATRDKTSSSAGEVFFKIVQSAV